MQLLISSDIFLEYQRVAQELSVQFAGVNISDVLDLLVVKAETIDTEALPEQVCADADDDKFIACAAAGSSRLIVSGDKHLLDVSRYQRIEVIKLRQFVERYLS